MTHAWYGERILPPDGDKKIVNYKYRGGDLSKIYKHITGPLAQAMVDYVYPETMA